MSAVLPEISSRIEIVNESGDMVSLASFLHPVIPFLLLDGWCYTPETCARLDRRIEELRRKLGLDPEVVL